MSSRGPSSEKKHNSRYMISSIIYGDHDDTKNDREFYVLSGQLFYTSTSVNSHLTPGTSLPGFGYAPHHNHSGSRIVKPNEEKNAILYHEAEIKEIQSYYRNACYELHISPEDDVLNNLWRFGNRTNLKLSIGKGGGLWDTPIGAIIARQARIKPGENQIYTRPIGKTGDNGLVNLFCLTQGMNPNYVQKHVITSAWHALLYYRELNEFLDIYLQQFKNRFNDFRSTLGGIRLFFSEIAPKLQDEKKEPSEQWAEILKHIEANPKSRSAEIVATMRIKQKIQELLFVNRILLESKITSKELEAIIPRLLRPEYIERKRASSDTPLPSPSEGEKTESKASVPA